MVSFLGLAVFSLVLPGLVQSQEVGPAATALFLSFVSTVGPMPPRAKQHSPESQPSPLEPGTGLSVQEGKGGEPGPQVSPPPQLLQGLGHL